MTKGPSSPVFPILEPKILNLLAWKRLNLTAIYKILKQHPRVVWIALQSLVKLQLAEQIPKVRGTDARERYYQLTLRGKILFEMIKQMKPYYLSLADLILSERYGGKIKNYIVQSHMTLRELSAGTRENFPLRFTPQRDEPFWKLSMESLKMKGVSVEPGESSSTGTEVINKLAGKEITMTLMNRAAIDYVIETSPSMMKDVIIVGAFGYPSYKVLLQDGTAEKTGIFFPEGSIHRGEFGRRIASERGIRAEAVVKYSCLLDGFLEREYYSAVSNFPYDVIFPICSSYDFKVVETDREPDLLVVNKNVVEKSNVQILRTKNVLEDAYKLLLKQSWKYKCLLRYIDALPEKLQQFEDKLPAIRQI